MEETQTGSLDRPDITNVLPRYRLRRQLSRTVMSEVFHAEDTELGVDVALKVIRPALMRHPAFAARFARESQIALQLRHPNIVDVYAAGRAGREGREIGYLAMRFVKGANLGTVIAERGAFDPDEAVRLARQLAAALDTAHAQGLVHRDVKPANVLVEEATGRYYLCDFGIAKTATAETVTATGAAVGTALYWAPEQQVDGRAVDFRADVYSLGCVLYDCLAGTPPTAARGQQRATPMGGAAVERVLRKAMAERPEQRYASCGEFAEELAGAVRRGRLRRRLSAAGGPAVLRVGAVLVLLAAVLAPGPRQEAVDLTRVPSALRGDCQVAGTSMRGATAAVSCEDAAGRDVLTAMFPTERAADAVYRRAAGRAGLSVEGDCVGGDTGEQRYPATGQQRGRVLCYTEAGRAVRLWVDSRERTVSRVEAADPAALRSSWTELVGREPTFPTGEERRLIEVAAGTNCVRAPVADLERYPEAAAAVTCVPHGAGARSVTYYGFESRAALRSDFAAEVKGAKAEAGSCTRPGKFLGTERHDWLGTDLGQVLCQPDDDGTLHVDWSMEPLLVVGTVSGTDGDALGGWWSDWHLAPLGRIVDEVNAHASPPFPTKTESALLDHVPKASRVNCVRQSPDQKWQDVGAANVTGVICGPTSGADQVAYYQFSSATQMRRVFNSSPDSISNCTRVEGRFGGTERYSRGKRSGLIGCGNGAAKGERYLNWTDDKLAIAAYAYGTSDPAAMVDWWTYDAGPV